MILFAMTMFVACSDDSDDAVPSVGGTLTATVDGVDFTATLGAIATSGTSGVGEVVTVTGSDANGQQIQVIATGVTGTGTYSFSGITASNSGRWTAGISPSDTYVTLVGQGSGTLEITSMDANTVVGTFSFDAANTDGRSVSVTNGQFNADFQ